MFLRLLTMSAVKGDSEMTEAIMVPFASDGICTVAISAYDKDFIQIGIVDGTRLLIPIPDEKAHAHYFRLLLQALEHGERLDFGRELCGILAESVEDVYKACDGRGASCNYYRMLCLASSYNHSRVTNSLPRVELF